MFRITFVCLVTMFAAAVASVTSSVALGADGPRNSTVSVGTSRVETSHVDASRGEASHGEADRTETRINEDTHPDISMNSNWAGVMLVAILGLFAAAAVVGPIVRANMPEEVPPAHSHDEPPGASHHHGPGGTIDPVGHH